MHLRDHVRDDDLNVAIRVMLESFIEVPTARARGVRGHESAHDAPRDFYLLGS